MRGSSPLKLVRVLLIACGLISIGTAVYRMKLEWSSPTATQTPMLETPAELSKLTLDELRSRKDKIQRQMALDQSIRHEKSNVDLLMITNGLSLLVLLGALIYLRRQQALAVESQPPLKVSVSCRGSVGPGVKAIPNC